VLPDDPPPIVVSAFGPRAATLAGEIGDGFMNTAPDRELLDEFETAGGAGKPTYGKVDVCFAASEEEARRTAHRTWPTSALPGELGQILPLPAHFEQAVELVTEDLVADTILCSPDPARHVEALQAYVDAGYSHVLVQQCGPEQEPFVRLYEREVLPELRRA
jgi:G6PDH family F420-dependent oxidoreductase